MALSYNKGQNGLQKISHKIQYSNFNKLKTMLKSLQLPIIKIDNNRIIKVSYQKMLQVLLEMKEIGKEK